MKRITAIITAITIITAMAVPAWAADEYVCISEGLEGIANDGRSTSYYAGNKNHSPNALTIDLEKKYILDHVMVEVVYANTNSVYVSNDPDFTSPIELDLDRTESRKNFYKIPSADANKPYRYVRYNFTTDGSRDVRVREFQVYTTAENASGAGTE